MEFLDIDENGMVRGIRHAGPDYLNPHRIYTDTPRIDVSPGFDSNRVGVSDLERATDNEFAINPAVKESLTAEDEVAYATPIRSGKDSGTASGGENAESAEKCRVGEPDYPTANGRQVKNGTGIEEIEWGTVNLQVKNATGMSRERAAEVLMKRRTRLWREMGGMAKCDLFFNETVTESKAIDVALASLRGPVPDPSTGLVPCGCGGVAKLYHYDVDDAFRDGFPDDEWWNVYCDACGMGTGNEETDGKAIAAWNLAMSGQTADQNPAKPRSETALNPEAEATVQDCGKSGCSFQGGPR